MALRSIMKKISTDKTNWKTDGTAKKDKFNVQYIG